MLVAFNRRGKEGGERAQCPLPSFDETTNAFRLDFARFGSLQGLCQLIGAARGATTAGIALKNRNDPIGRLALDELRDSLQIAVAAADEAHVVHIAVDDVEIDLARARAARIECMHAIPPWNFS